MKILSKIMLVIITMTVLIALPQINVYAATATEALEGVEGNTSGKDFVDGANSMRAVVNRVLGFLQIASALLAVVIIAATGFRYIMETPDMKNELKKSMIPIIVGILLVFFATSIAKFFIGMFQTTGVTVHRV